MYICKTIHLSMLKQSKTTSVFGYARGLSRSYASCPAVSHNDNSISSPFRFIDFTVVSKTVGVWSSGICPFYKWKIAFVIKFRVEGNLNIIKLMIMFLVWLHLSKFFIQKSQKTLGVVQGYAMPLS